jgi:Protein of unknown function (DUF1488)
MIIDFPNLDAWDGKRDVVTFPANVDEKRIQCAISWEALSDNFGGDRANLMHSFHANRPSIEAKAERLILQGRFETDGSIFIRSQDGT